MKKYKNTVIKLAIVAALIGFISTETGKQYAEQLKPMIEIILQQ